MNDEIEILVDEVGSKYYVLKNSELNLSNNNENIKRVKNKWYYKSKLLHRLDGPAIESYTGETEWYKNGVSHREDGGPAVEELDGTKKWYQNGLLHRLDGPAIESYNGGKEWYQNGLLHRLDGPAIESYNGEKEWYQNGELHRLDGPAIEKYEKRALFKKLIKGYYINGKEISEEAFNFEKELRYDLINTKKTIKRNKI